MIVFYSYSHKDEELRDELETHLSTLKRQKAIESWHDRRISPGKEWGHEIDSHIEAANITLLLVSADFIASDYCYGNEVKKALELHEFGTARVVPIILRPCEWHSAPFGKLQALPKDGKAVTTWVNRDEAWTDVVRGIRHVVSELAVAQASQADSIPAVVRATTKNTNVRSSSGSGLIASDVLEITRVGMRCTEKNNSWWRYSWLFSAKNQSSSRTEFDAVIRFVDADGFIIADDHANKLAVDPEEEKDFRGFQLINAQGAGEVKNLLVELSLRR